MRLLGFIAVASLSLTAFVPAQASHTRGGKVRASTVTVWLLTTEGRSVEGTTEDVQIPVSVDNESRTINLRGLLSVNSGAPASEAEASKIAAGLRAVQGSDHRAMETAISELTDIGLPVLSPLLAAYKDTDLHEPNPLYRLFGRVVPGYADRLERTLDLIRLTDGVAIRGRAHLPDFNIHAANGSDQTVSGASIRRLAVRRPSINRTFTVEALRHCTQIEFLDTGVRLNPASRVEARADGYTRLSFDIDGWSCGPDGIKVPGPNYKTTDVDGFAFGALVGRVGPTGSRWKAGSSVRKTNLGPGRLFFAVNDNGHWQNNVGSYRVRLRATDAYDLGDPQ